MPDLKLIPGKFVWYELVTKDIKQAQAFYGEVLGWKVKPFPMGSSSYDMICTADALDTMIGGYTPPDRQGEPAQWLSYVTVEDVDAAAKAATAAGGKVIRPPFDSPGVGRMARIADPLGAELYLFRSATGDKPDAPATSGQFFWNELHTSDATKALAFYEKVVGFEHRSVDMGSDTYHIISKGGTDRGGVMGDADAGTRPQWLPYVAVDDVDATTARAQRLGAKVPQEPADIPSIGRYAVLQDPTGAVLAIMRPQPRDKG